MKNKAPRSLPPLQLEDHIALLQALVVVAWVGAAGTFITEIWVRLSPIGWPLFGGFPTMYRALMVEFLITAGALTILLLKGDWYERVPRKSADRVRFLLLAVIIWLGLHLGLAFHWTGALQGPVLPWIPLLVLATLLLLPGATGWWTAAYLVAVPSMVLVLESADLIQSPGPLARAFEFAGENATPLGRGALLVGFLFAVLLAVRLRARAPGGSGVLIKGAELDPSTGLFHRSFLEKRLGAELERQRRHGGSTTLLLMNLEGLAGNASHPRSGDERLNAIARRLLDGIRLYSDTPTRYGMTTLAAMLQTSTDDGVNGVVQRVDEMLRTHESGIVARFGAVLVRDPTGLQGPQVMAQAEAALQKAVAGAPPVIVEAKA